MIAKELRDNLTLLLLTGAITGISLAFIVFIGSSNLLLFAFLFLLLLAYCRFLFAEKKKLLIFFLTACLFFAISTIQNQQSKDDIYQLYTESNLDNKRVTLSGTLKSIQQRDQSQKGILEITDIKLPDSEKSRPATGTITISIYGKGTILTPGDTLSLLEVKLREIRNFNNPGTFDYVTFQRLKGIYLSTSLGNNKLIITDHKNNSLAAKLHKLRIKITEEIEKAPEGGFILAILLGDKRNIGTSVQETFSEAGIAHLFAVSGLHVGFISFAFFFLFKVIFAIFCRKFCLEAFLNGNFERLAALSTILPTIAYAMLVGEKSSAIRAAVMIVTYLLIFSLGYRRALFNSVNIAALSLLIYNPFFLYEIGFQLSFCAVYAILFGFYLLKAEFQKDYLDFEGLTLLKGVLNYLKVVFLTSIFAFFGTFPLILHYFQLISFGGLFVNLIAIPLATVIVPIAFLGMLSLWMSEFLSHFCFTFAGELLRWLYLVAKWTAESSLSHIYLPSPGSESVLLIYLFLCLWAVYFREVSEFARTFKKGFLYLFVALFILYIFPNKINPKASIYFLDVGQGESFFITTETGITILIDGGKRYSYTTKKKGKTITKEGLDMGRAVVARFLRQKNIYRIDRMVVTHHHNDHSGGLKYLINNFDIGIFYVSPYFLNNAQEYKELFALLKKKNVTVKLVSSDDYIFKSEKTEVKVVHPNLELVSPDTDASDNSLVNNLALVLEFFSFGNRFLLTSDIEAEGEAKLLQHYQKEVKVLKIPHHGSKSSSTPEFLDALKPEIGIISVAKYNKFRQPSKAVLERLKERKIEILRTDQVGCIGFSMRKDFFENSGC